MANLLERHRPILAGAVFADSYRPGAGSLLAVTAFNLRTQWPISQPSRTTHIVEVGMTLTQIRSRLGRLRKPCRLGHDWTELAYPPACRTCGRTRILPSVD